MEFTSVVNIIQQKMNLSLNESYLLTKQKCLDMKIKTGFYNIEPEGFIQFLSYYYNYKKKYNE